MKKYVVLLVIVLLVGILGELLDNWLGIDITKQPIQIHTLFFILGGGCIGLMLRILFPSNW